MSELLPGQSPLEILFVTGLLGGGAAWLAGRAIARTWRPIWHVVGYMALLGAAVRFRAFRPFRRRAAIAWRLCDRRNVRHASGMPLLARHPHHPDGESVPVAL